MTDDRQIVYLIFGGRSAEHIVSILTSKRIYECLNPKKFDVRTIGIDQNGTWWLGTHILRAFDNKQVAGQADNSEVFGPTHVMWRDGTHKRNPIFWPLMHGQYGEDSTIQGLLEFENVPYVGCGPAASAIGINKIATKTYLRGAGINVGAWYGLRRSDWYAESRVKTLHGIFSTMSSKVFVKPARLGSSIGISKVEHDANALVDAIDKAFLYGDRVIIEDAYTMRELQVSVIGNDEPQTSEVNEISYDGDFYNTEQKTQIAGGPKQYNVPASVPVDVRETVRQLAVKVYTTLDCAGYARLDFFWLDNGALLLNEINTIPGMAGLVFPLTWECVGKDMEWVTSELITLGLRRWTEQQGDLAHIHDIKLWNDPPTTDSDQSQSPE